MAEGSLTIEIESSVEAQRLWNAMVKDEHNLLPQQAPQIISGVTFVHGDGGVGSIKQFNFTPVNKDFSYVKERVDEVDEANFVYSCSHVEGGLLGKRVASAKFQQKYIPKSEGGCKFVWRCDYESLPGVEHEEDKVQEAKDNITALFRMLEAYLISNPGLYC
uniref:TSA: Wollemia nobilis Ref_Wollemi_Transcript_15257_977 transcribed RNA sequence n=1 Tax=Wollemia nobilis TaxID=56998 RepID=A0A0C9S3F2_9CONI